MELPPGSHSDFPDKVGPRSSLDAFKEQHLSCTSVRTGLAWPAGSRATTVFSTEGLQPEHMAGTLRRPESACKRAMSKLPAVPPGAWQCPRWEWSVPVWRDQRRGDKHKRHTILSSQFLELNSQRQKVERWLPGAGGPGLGCVCVLGGGRECVWGR